MTHIGTPLGISIPVWDSEAASTMIIPPIFAGHDGSFASFLNGAFISVQRRLASLPMCRPHAIRLGLEDANAIAEPIVSMSPFLPVRTGTAPFPAALSIQAANLSKFIPQEIASTFHMWIQVQPLAWP